ncbi:MAG TPA: LytTR family DNA-binding domain-containing protein [Gemmatimonadaceae bacterium]|nr:LytTR family DNA-binding domain-containing protein [Gemmatimonadaceae bacterium]
MRVLLIEDEPLARQRLRLMLGEHADVQVVGECADAPDGIRTAHELRPDVLLLDIRLPGADGFAVLDGLRGLVPAPFVVFITAFADHAVRAFDESAVDYLLKPYNGVRLARSLERARRAMAARTTDALLGEVQALTRALRTGVAHPGARHEAMEASAVMSGPPGAAPGFPDRISVTVGKRVVFVPVDDIEWVEADRNYACLHAGKQQYLLRRTLSDLERVLDPVRFVRVHRSAIVRRDRVRELEPLPNGGARVTMRSGAVVPVAAAFRDRIIATRRTSVTK